MVIKVYWPKTRESNGGFDAFYQTVEMKKKKKNQEIIDQRKEAFDTWLMFITDRILSWKAILPVEISKQLNWSPESLPVVERYLLANFELADQGRKDKRPALDAMVSYTGQVFQQNIPGTFWKIDVEDETNVYYNLPYLVFKLGSPLCPHWLISDALSSLSGTELKERYDIKFKDYLEYKAYMDKKKASFE